MEGNIRSEEMLDERRMNLRKVILMKLSILLIPSITIQERHTSVKNILF